MISPCSPADPATCSVAMKTPMPSTAFSQAQPDNTAMNDRQDLLPSHLSPSASLGGLGSGGAGGPLAAPSRGADCLLHACRVLNFLTSLCALLCALAFGMAMWVRGDAPVKVGWGGGGLGWGWGGWLASQVLACLPPAAAFAACASTHTACPAPPSLPLPLNLWRQQDAYFYSGPAVRVFGIAIALLVVLVESEWRRVLQLVPLLDAWLGRGVLQVRACLGLGVGAGE